MIGRFIVLQNRDHHPHRPQREFRRREREMAVGMQHGFQGSISHVLPFVVYGCLRRVRSSQLQSPEFPPRLLLRSLCPDKFDLFLHVVKDWLQESCFTRCVSFGN